MKNYYSVRNITQMFKEVLPIQILSLLTSSLSGIVNGLIVGAYLTSADMIALGYATPIQKVVLVCSTIVATGLRIICGNYIGRGEKDKVKETFSCAINILLIISVCLTITAELFSLPIARLISNPEAAERTAEYIRGLGFGLGPSILIPCLMSFLQLQNEGTYALISTVFLALSNYIIADLAMKFLNIEIFGVGLVTSISQFLTLLFLIIKFIRMKKNYYIFKISNKSLYKEIIFVGFPSALCQLLYAFRDSRLLKILYEVGGNTAVNALSIFYTSCGPLDAFCSGVGHSMLLIGSICVGEKDEKSLKSLFTIATFSGLVLVVIKWIFVYFAAGPIASFYGATGIVKDEVILAYNAIYISCALNIVRNNLLYSHQACGDVKYCNLFIILVAYSFPVTFALIGSKFFGTMGVYLTYTFMEIACILGMVIYSRIQKGKPVNCIQDLLIPGGKLRKNNCYTSTIKSKEEISNISKEIEDFCSNEGIDKRRCMLSGLCVEELSTNILERAFPKTTRTKEKFIDIYVDVENEDVNIRVKDNAAPIDPHIKINESLDPTANIGIRMVSKIAKHMEYQNNFHLNQLIIKI